MREIKFKFWDKTNQRFIKPDSIERPLINAYGSVLIYKDQYANDIEPIQFTGIKDKNGTEIYEGDIINVESEGIYAVVYDNNYAVFRYGRDTFYVSLLERLEVIGNIYENPELLK